MNYGKTGILIFILFILLTSIPLSGWTEDISILESGVSRLVIGYHPEISSIDSLSEKGKSYRIFNYKEHSFRDVRGYPMIPTRTVYFVSAGNNPPQIEINSLSAKTLTGIILAPKPINASNSDGFSIPLYIEEPAAYSLSGFNPAKFANLGKNIKSDGFSIWELELTPILFDASKSVVAKSDSFNIIINLGDGSAVNKADIPAYVINRNAFSTKFPATSSLKSASVNQSPFANDEWYRISLSDNGIYSLTGADLAKAGFGTGTVKSQDIHIYYGGGKPLNITPHPVTTDDFKEIPIKVQDGGDGIFDTVDHILFYGESLSRFLLDDNSDSVFYQNYLYADKGENIYWINISSSIPPKRMGTTGETPNSAIIKNSFRELTHIEQEVFIELLDVYNIESGINWYWDSIYRNIKQYSFNAPGRVDNDSTVVRIGFDNGMSKISYGSTEYMQIYRWHYIGVKVNNESTIDGSITTSSQKYKNYILRNPLKTESNILSIWRKNEKENENIRLDWIEIDYERDLKLTDNRMEIILRGTGNPVTYRISNVTSPNTEIYDSSDSFGINEITNALYDSNAKTLSFQLNIPNGSKRKISICSRSDYIKPSVSKKKNTFLRNPNSIYNYVVISHGNFMDSASKLANWRSRDRFKTLVVNVADIYDEFSWGVYDPVAIRDFLKYLYEADATKSYKYCCILGDTTNKYKNFGDNKLRNFVPTYTTVDATGDGITSDDFFSWFDDNEIPAFATGRLCVNDKETASNLVDKIINYEKNPATGIWHNRILLIADDGYGFQGSVQPIDKTFTTDIESIDRGNADGDFIPKSLERKKIMMVEYPMDNNLKKPLVTEDLFAALNDGYAIFNFIGHGNNDVLAHEYILKGSRDIERFNNGNKLPLFLVFSCSVGQFDKPENIALGEMLSTRKNGGCIAVIAASRVTENSHNVIFNKSYYRDLFFDTENPDFRIGHAIQKAKTTHNRDSNSLKYILFGDPAQKLAIPKYKFDVAVTDTLYRLEKVAVTGSINDGLTSSVYDTLYVKGFGPRISKTFTISTEKVNYTMPGKVFFNAEIPLNGKSFDVQFVVPKDLSPGSDSLSAGGNAQILMYAYGKGNEASCSMDSLVIGGLYPNAPDDRIGPEIKLTFDGKSFGEGDYIKRQPVFSAVLTDSSGINILGDRGHNMKLTIDKSDVIVLTDKFKNINSYSTGKVDYALPVLSPGEHDFEFSVFDNYNNASKISFKGNVQGSETGNVVISKLLNYPNPMSTNGTSFTFSLTDDVRRADIKIYSQSGRMVDKIRFNAGYGFNQVAWKPPVSLSNGVYFYKLSVISVTGRKSSKIEKLVVMK